MKGYAGDQMKAVIPAAGMGLRFLPLTKEQPKEMLPVVDKPTIQYVVEEAVAAGIEDIIIITGRGKTSIENHFDRSYELECLLERQNKTEYLNCIRYISNLANIYYLRQKEQRGLGDAIYKARKFVGDEPFAVMLGDTVNISKVPVIKQLMNAHEKYSCSVIAVEPVAKSKVKDYGIIRYKELEPCIFDVVDLVEKPALEKAPSNMGITGTYLFTPAIFDCIERTEPGYNGEIQLTDAMSLLKDEERLIAYQFEGKRYDIGDMMGWLKTEIELSLNHPVYGKELTEFTKDILKERLNHL
jgi:UTP--glucose-1-phosphate uridylyltransferase